jgi:hypothetical protein
MLFLKLVEDVFTEYEKEYNKKNLKGLLQILIIF